MLAPVAEGAGRDAVDAEAEQIPERREPQLPARPPAAGPEQQQAPEPLVHQELRDEALDPVAPPGQGDGAGARRRGSHALDPGEAAEVEAPRDQRARHRAKGPQHEDHREHPGQPPQLRHAVERRDPRGGEQGRRREGSARQEHGPEHRRAMDLVEPAALHQRFLEAEVGDRGDELDEHRHHGEEPEVPRAEPPCEGDAEGEADGLPSDPPRDAPRERPDAPLAESLVHAPARTVRPPQGRRPDRQGVACASSRR